MSSRAKNSVVNDAIIYRIVENLKVGMLIQEVKGGYRVGDPMLRSLLLTPADVDGDVSTYRV